MLSCCRYCLANEHQKIRGVQNTIILYQCGTIQELLMQSPDCPAIKRSDFCVYVEYIKDKIKSLEKEETKTELEYITCPLCARKMYVEKVGLQSQIKIWICSNCKYDVGRSWNTGDKKQKKIVADQIKKIIIDREKFLEDLMEKGE